MTALQQSMTALQHSMIALKQSRTALQHSMIALQHSMTALHHSMTALQHSMTALQHSMSLSDTASNPTTCDAVVLLCRCLGFPSQSPAAEHLPKHAQHGIRQLSMRCMHMRCQLQQGRFPCCPAFSSPKPGAQTALMPSDATQSNLKTRYKKLSNSVQSRPGSVTEGYRLQAALAQTCFELICSMLLNGSDAAPEKQGCRGGWCCC